MITLTNEEAHTAYDDAMKRYAGWTHAEYDSPDHDEKARAHRWRWHWLDVALRAAMLHDTSACTRCPR